MTDDLKKIYRIYGELKDEYEQNWRPHHEELSKYLLPRKGEFLNSGKQKGGKRNEAIIDGEGMKAVSILAAGMQSGLTPPAQPWVKLRVENGEKQDIREVKEWLAKVDSIIHRTLHANNFYSPSYSGYEEQVVFGTSALFIDDVGDGEIEFVPVTVGTYLIDSRPARNVDTFFRRMSMRAFRVVEEFGIENVSRSIKNMVGKEKTGMQFVEIIQAIYLNDNKEVKTVYFEEKQPRGKEPKALRKDFYHEFPVAVTRWGMVGSEVMGRSPGMDALGDVKMLMVLQKELLQALAMQVRPPMNAPATMRGDYASLVPGSINYVDNLTGNGASFTPAHVPSVQFGEINYKIDQVKRDIREFFYADLFTMLTGQSATKNMTATEVSEKVSERLTILSPIIERQQQEFITPVVNRVFGILLRAGKLPPIPEVLVGEKIDVEAMSLLAQAQKRIAVSGVEGFVAFATAVAQAKPEVLDIMDADAILRTYADRMQIPIDMIRPKDAVEAERQERLRAQKAQEMGDNMIKAAGGLRDLSQANTGTDNALADAMQSFKQGGAG